MSSPTEQQVIAGMTSPGVKWTTPTITYSIPVAGSTWAVSGTEPSSSGYKVLSAAQADYFRQHMAHVASLIATPIVETNDLVTQGQLRIAFTTPDFNASAWSYGPYPGLGAEAGDMWLNPSANTAGNFEVGVGSDVGADRLRYILLFVIGQALGLQGPGADKVGAEYANSGYSIMSLSPYPHFSQFKIGMVDGKAQVQSSVVQNDGFMVFDILALQSLYGANKTTRTGDDRYTFDETKAVVRTIYDAGGTDVIDLTGHKRASVIDLTPGAYSSIDVFSAADQIAYWRAAFPNSGIDVDFFINLTGDQLYTGQNNLGIAYGVVIENVIAGSGADVVKGNGASNTIDGGGGDDQIFGGEGDDDLTGGAGSDVIDGGGGLDVARYDGAAASYRIAVDALGWTVSDLRTGRTADVDTLRNIEKLAFQDATLSLGAHRLSLAIGNILRAQPGEAAAQALIVELNPKVIGGLLDGDLLGATLAKTAISTTSVATLSYQFFTGHIPGEGGMNYLVAAQGPNANNLNSAYYQSFNLENRYINFAVNLGKNGEGATKFTADYGGLSLFDATRKAYAVIFGGAPTDDKVHALIDSRVSYFESYGHDGANGLGTKAAMVGWLLAEAAKADIGMYAKANDAFLIDLADGAAYGVDLVGVYGKAAYNYPG